MKVVLSDYAGSFRLPNEVKLWLLRERNAFHLFSSTKIKDSNFSLQAVKTVMGESNNYSGRYDDTWGYFNSNIIKFDEVAFYGLLFEVKSGEEFRSDEDLVKAVKKMDPRDIKVVEASGNFRIETGRDGEYLLKQQRRN